MYLGLRGRFSNTLIIRIFYYQRIFLRIFYSIKKRPLLFTFTAEGTGLEPASLFRRRFSRPVHYHSATPPWPAKTRCAPF